MNINPAAKRVLIFSDSLAWGYIPDSNHQRYPTNVRWPGKLQEQLGLGYEIVEENLNSRGIENGDPRPGKEGRRALDYIIPCLDSHDPLDYVIVLLGTNELKYENRQSAEQVGKSMEALLQLIIERPSQFRTQRPKVILLAPPIINDLTEYCSQGDKYNGATEKSKQLGKVYENLGAKLGINFSSLAEIATVGSDGVHLDADNHNKVAVAVGNLLAHT